MGKLKYEYWSMTNLFDEYECSNIYDEVRVYVDNIEERVNKQGKEYILVGIEDVTANNTDKYDSVGLVTTDLIKKQLEELNVLWYEIQSIVFIKLKSSSTGFIYYMIKSVYTDNGEIMLGGSTNSYLNIIEELNNSSEPQQTFNILDLIVSPVIDDGIRYNTYTLRIGKGTYINLTRNFNKELTRLERTHDIKKLSGITFSLINGIWKISKLLFK